jgi:tetratricopeptide (TPR) repeat protein
MERDGVFYIVPNILIKNVPKSICKFLKENNDSIPAELVNIIIRCLEIQPNERWKEKKKNESFQYFDTILEELIKLYLQVTGRNYTVFQDPSYSLNSDLRYHLRAKSLEKLRAPEHLTKEFYDKLLELKPLNFTEWSNMGRYLSDIKRYDEALNCYSRSIDLNDKFVLSWYNKANTLVDLERYEEALECYDKAIEVDPTYSLSFYYKAIALEKLQRYDEALECYDKAIEVDNNDFITINAKGNLLSYLKRYDKALLCYDDAIRIDKNYAFTWYNRAQTLDDLGRKVESLESYDNAIKIDRNDVEHFFYKGNVLEELERYKDALLCYDEAIRIDESFILTWNNKGNILKKFGRFNEAIECFDKAIEIDSKFYPLWFNKGNTLVAMADTEKNSDLQAKSYDNAIKCYLNAVREISVISAVVYYNLAETYMKMYIITNKDEYKNSTITALISAFNLDARFKIRAKNDRIFENIKTDKKFREIVGDNEQSNDES